MSRCLPFLKWIGVSVVVIGLWVSDSPAQTPLIYIDVNDTIDVAPGSSVPVSLFIQNMGDSIAGFQFALGLSRPDLMEFTSSRAIQTCYRCSDAACTTVTAVPCTVEVVPMTTVGTLTYNWEYVQARTDSIPPKLNVYLTGLVDNTLDKLPPPILPYSSGVLITVIGHVLCNIPDTLQDRRVEITASPVGSYFSDTQGHLITPLSFTSGSVTVKHGQRGDLNYDGKINVLDIVRVINIVFKAGAQPCPSNLADANCDNVKNVLDVVKLINYVFKAGPHPC